MGTTTPRFHVRARRTRCDVQPDPGRGQLDARHGLHPHQPEAASRRARLRPLAEGPLHRPRRFRRAHPVGGGLPVHRGAGWTGLSARGPQGRVGSRTICSRSRRSASTCRALMGYDGPRRRDGSRRVRGRRCARAPAARHGRPRRARQAHARGRAQAAALGLERHAARLRSTRHWRCEEDFGRLFRFERDYTDWMWLLLEPEGHASASSRSSGTISTRSTPRPSSCTTPIAGRSPGRPASRPTSPRADGTPTQRTARSSLRALARLRGRADGPRGHYKPHPDPAQERFFFGLLRECLAEGVITRDGRRRRDRAAPRPARRARGAELAIGRLGDRLDAETTGSALGSGSEERLDASRRRARSRRRVAAAAP